MNGLRTRIALVLVISIVAVVGLATTATIVVIAPRPPEKLAQTTAMLIPLFESTQASSSHPAGLLDAASDGAVRQATTRVLQQALRETGIYNRIVVTKPADRDLAVVSVELVGLSVGRSIHQQHTKKKDQIEHRKHEQATSRPPFLVIAPTYLP